MSEIYGEREGPYRMTNMVLQTQENWGAIRRVESGRRLILQKLPTVANEQLAGWLIEAVLRYSGKPLAVATLQGMPVLFPIVLDQPLAYIASNSPTMELLAEGSSLQYVALRSSF